MGTQACEVDEPVCWTIFKGYITVFKILQIFYPCFSHSITLSIQYWQKVQCWQRAPTYWCLRLSIFTWVSNLEILKIQGSNWLKPLKWYDITVILYGSYIIFPIWFWKWFDFATFQKIMQMLSYYKIIFHMLFRAFHINPV